MITQLTFDDVNIRPQYSEVLSRSTISLQTRFTNNWNISVPLISSPMETVTGSEMAIEMMRLGGVGCVHRFNSIAEQVEIVKTIFNYRGIAVGSYGPICVAIGVTDDYLERATELVKMGADVLLLDVAHGHHKLVKDAITKIKGHVGPVEIIAGNVSTFEACKALQDWGADAIRFGQGNGSLCETRIRTGIGVPQISGLLSCSSIKIPIISDGGIRTAGDVAKALGAGASTVMLGSLLAGTTETPNPIEMVGRWPNEVLYKKFMGSASSESKSLRGETKNVEGNSKLIPYKGHAARIINDIEDGVRSSCSYVGAKTLSEFCENVEFVRVTPAGTVEAQPHLL